MPPLIALPGTLLDARSLAPALLALRLRAQTVLLGKARPWALKCSAWPHWATNLRSGQDNQPPAS